MIDIICLIVLGAVLWTVGSEGISGAIQTFLCTLLAALLAMNFFEPLAIQIAPLMPGEYCDFVALVGLFTALVFGLRIASENLSPSYIQVIPSLDTFGRWLFGAATGYLTVAFLLTSIHTAPLPREFLGFRAERNNFFGSAPDRQWLGFTQYVSEKTLGWSSRKKIGEFEVNPNAFDGRLEIVGDPTKPYSIRNSKGKDVPQVIWASFPIRYAMRRRRIEMNQGSSSASSGAPVAPSLPAAPAKGTGKTNNVQPSF